MVTNAAATNANSTLQRNPNFKGCGEGKQLRQAWADLEEDTFADDVCEAFQRGFFEPNSTGASGAEILDAAVGESTQNSEIDMCQRWEMCSVSRRPFEGVWQHASNKVSISEHLQFESPGIANDVSPTVFDTSVASTGRAGTTNKTNPDHIDAEHKPRSWQGEINSVDDEAAHEVLNNITGVNIVEHQAPDFSNQRTH